MNSRQYQQIRVLVIFFVGVIIAVSLFQDSFLLSTAGIITGLLFLLLVRSKTRINIDEREKTIREKAANLTYAIFAPTMGIAAFLLLLPSKGGLSVFSKGEWLYIESLGMILAYLTLFLIALYAISYHFLNRKYGGGGNEQ